MVFIGSPDFRIRSSEWTLHRPSQANVSEWTGRRTVVTDPWHGKWIARVDLAPMADEHAAPVLAFLAKCRGQLATFALPATAGAQNSNTGVTVAVSEVAGARAVWISGAATPLTAGQKMTINDQLLQVTDVDSGRVAFEPPLREAASAGTPVETAEPYAVVYMASSTSSHVIDLGPIYGISFDVEEAVGEPRASSYAISLELTTQRYYVSGSRKALLSSVAGYTFTRSGTKLAIDSDGTVDSFAANVPAINGGGFHCFGAVTNQHTHSQQFDNAAWGKTGVTVTANAAAAPDGTTTADKISHLNTGVGSNAFVSQNAIFSTGGKKTISVVAKAGTASWLYIRAFSYSLTGAGAVNADAYFNLAAGALGTAANCAAAIRSLGGGLYLCCIEIDLDGTDIAGAVRYYLAEGDGDIVFSTAGTYDLYLWQAQALSIGGLGNNPPLVPTTGSTAAIGASDLEVAASIAGDFIAWAVIDLPQIPTSGVPFCYSTAGGGSSEDFIQTFISGTSFTAGSVVGSVTQTAPGAITVTAGRGVFMLRVWHGLLSIAYKAPNGTITFGSASTASVPSVTAVDIGAGLGGSSQVNGTIKGFYHLNGTFSEADATAILGAA